MFDEATPAELQVPFGTKAETCSPKFTVLRALNGRKSVKVFSKGSVRPYDKAIKFAPQEVEIDNFTTLVDVLTGLETEEDKLVVMGQIAAHYKGHSSIPRRKKPRNGQAASLVDNGSRAAMFDCDDIAVPDGFGWNDTPALAEAIWTILTQRVPVLKDVRVFWQASASAGQPKAVKIAKFHFWVLLSDPLYECEKKALYRLARTDTSLACPIQPHYIGQPVFDGVPDPLADQPRSGVIAGEIDYVKTCQFVSDNAEIAQTVREPQSRKSQAVASLALHNESPRATWVERQLNNSCNAILTADERNNAINKEAFFFGGAVAKDLIDRSTAYDRLFEAAAATGH